MFSRFFSRGFVLLSLLALGCVFPNTNTNTTMGLLEDRELNGVDWIEVNFLGPVALNYHTITPVAWWDANSTEGTIPLTPDGPSNQLDLGIDHYRNQFPVCVFLVPTWGTGGQDDLIKVYAGLNPNGVMDDGSSFSYQLTWDQMVTGYQQYMNPNSNNPQSVYWPGHNEADPLFGGGYDAQNPPLTAEGKLDSVIVHRQGENEADYSAQDVKNAIEEGPPAAGEPWGPMKNSQICAKPGQYISFRIKSVANPPPTSSSTGTNASPTGSQGKTEVPGGSDAGTSASKKLVFGGGGCSIQTFSGTPSGISWIWSLLVASGIISGIYRWKWTKK